MHVALCYQKEVWEAVRDSVFHAQKDRLWRQEQQVKDVEPCVALQKIGYQDIHILTSHKVRWF